MKPRVVISAGHGIGCPRGGATGPNGLKEMDVVLKASWMLHEKLKSDFDVLMVRPTEYYISLGARAREANRFNAELFFAIHCNGYNGIASGIETWHYPGSKKGEKAAKLIQDQTMQQFPQSIDRGLKTSAGLAVLNRTNMPSVLHEMEFIDVPEMEARLSEDHNLQKYADAWNVAIRLYFNKI